MLNALHMLFNPATYKAQNYSPKVALVFVAIMAVAAVPAYLYERHLHLAADRITATVIALVPKYEGESRWYYAELQFTDKAGMTQNVIKRYDTAGVRRGVRVGGKVELLFNPDYPGASLKSDTWDDAWGITSTTIFGVGICFFVVLITVVVRKTAGVPLSS